MQHNKIPTFLSLVFVFIFVIFATPALVEARVQFLENEQDGGGGRLVEFFNPNNDYEYVPAPGEDPVRLPPPPAPPVSTGGSGGDLCWGSTCYEMTDEQLEDWIGDYFEAIISEYGSVEGGSVILRDDFGRVVSIACFNGGVVTVSYNTAPVPSLNPPTIGGPTSGFTNTTYSFTFIAN